MRCDGCSLHTDPELTQLAVYDSRITVQHKMHFNVRNMCSFFLLCFWLNMFSSKKLRASMEASDEKHCCPHAGPLFALQSPASLLRHPPTVFHHFIPPTNITLQKTYCLLALIRDMMLTDSVPAVSLQLHKYHLR